MLTEVRPSAGYPAPKIRLNKRLKALLASVAMATVAMILPVTVAAAGANNGAYPNIKIISNTNTAATNAGEASAGAPNGGRQDLNTLMPVVERFLQIQAAGLPGAVTVELGRIDPRLNLGACFEPEAFLPKGNRIWGKTTVGIRCTAPTAWTVYLPATVRVRGDYYVAAVSLVQGQLLGANDLTKMSGDLTILPNGIVTDPAQAVGRTTILSMKMGTPLRQDGLRAQNAVQQGQSVRIIGVGSGFQVSTEGHALNNAVDGQPAQARTSTGQVVSGMAKSGGIIEINY